MARRISVRAHGGPEVLTIENFEPQKPGPGEVLVRTTAIGVNFIDVYFRTGLYKAEPPFTAGKELAGVIEEVGEGVTVLEPGDRVASASLSGTYATHVTAPASQLVRIPDDISDETAAAMMLKGMTARYLLRRTFRVEPGHTILFHAASGGVGSIATQWAHHIGARVIGTVGSDEKAERARSLGCDHVILYRTEDFVARVAEITEGEKCEVVYDSVGKATYPGSLDCLKPLGMYVLFGQSSGPITNFDPALLAQKGSLFMTRPSLFAYTSTRDALVATADDLFKVVSSGAVKIDIGLQLPLSEAAEAHRRLEARETTGSTILIPD